MTDCYVLVPISEKLIDVWIVTVDGLERFANTGKLPTDVRGMFLMQPDEGTLIASRERGRAAALEACRRAIPVYRACARFDPDYAAWGRWSFRHPKRRDRMRKRYVRWSGLRQTPLFGWMLCFTCWSRATLAPIDVIIDSVEMSLIRP